MNGRENYPLSSYPSYVGRGFGRDARRPKTRTEIDMENAALQRMFGFAPTMDPSGRLSYGGLSKSTLMGVARTGKPPTMIADGKKYTLQEDTQSYNRIMAGEREAARRSNRPAQEIMPTYRYVDEQGKPFKGTFLGGGSYGGFGGGRPQSSQRSWDNFVERAGPRNPNYGSNPRGRAVEMAQQSSDPQPAERPAPQPTPRPRTPPMPTGSYMSDQYGAGFTQQPLGFTGQPVSFTPAGGRSGFGPTPTALSTPPPFPEFDPESYWGSTGFGGLPRFPFSGY